MIVETAPPRLHVEIDGHGPTIVLAHGFGGSARNFRAQVRELGRRFRIVRFDARGHARSDAPAEHGAYAPDAFVADLARVLDAAGAPAAIVGGVSMGAGIALRFALAHPRRTRGLVLAAFPAGGRVTGSFAAVAEAFAAAIERDGLDAAGGRFVWGTDSGLDRRAAALIRQGFLEHAPHAVAAILRELIAIQPAPEEMSALLPRVRCPALVIVGAEDRLSLDASRKVAAALPDARLVVVPGAGHLVNVARPAAFNAEVAAFADRLGLTGDRSAGE